MPHSAVAGPVQDQTFMMIVAGIIVLAAVMLALYFAVRTFAEAARRPGCQRQDAERGPL